MIKTIFFDVDGTLYDETHAKIKAEMQTAEFAALKLNLPFQKVYDTFITSKNYVINSDKKDPNRNNRTKWYEHMLKSLNSDAINPQLLSEKYWEVVKSNIEPYYDLKLVLPELSEKFDLFVLTDELLEIQKEKLSILGLTDYFKGVISSTDVGAVKPHPELFEYAMKQANATAETSMMVGDNPARDILGGKSAGMTTAWIKRGKYFFYPVKTQETPDIIIKNYANFIFQIDDFVAKKVQSLSLSDKNIKKCK